jgi:hypothetical protein
LPTVDSFTPAGGPVGTTVHILGSHFSCGGGVTFNGVAAGYGVDSDSEIRAVVPAGATTGAIAVTTPSGTGSSASPFTVKANAPPSADFTFSCAGLTCSFDGGASSDPDGRIASYSWNFGDGSTGSGSATTHNYVQPAGYLVTLTVTDNDGSTGTESTSVTPISLNARGYSQRGRQKVDLSWSGPGGASFDVYRNGSEIATVQASAYTDTLNKKPGTYVYKVCSGAVCSNSASVSVS